MNENDQQVAQPSVPAPPNPYAAYVSSPPPPPSKTKRALWVVVGVLATAAGLVGGRLAMNALLAEDGPVDAGRYKLVPPASFEGLTLQDSGPRVDAIKEGQGAPKPGTTPVAVVYADQAGTAQLVVSGTAGRFTDDDPGAAVTAGMRAMGIKDGVVTTHEAGTPAGGALRCGTLPIQGGTLPMCMWADHSSLVTVTVPIENKPVTLDALAARAKALREAMEVPAS
ncbi:hypothetical protein OHS33_12030 [Streptomyces sp. NBC_00536]|uniref:hypothetical protein n=1 Tax=Streptomyces sp. NBC_00536 TaxID=2975769 RepID=UPI002E7FDC5E|nr:hypothetical protein [Streptomyces sp. NBC_00536]WUC79002.1 hypothetical protein OHS33_12030 [Streptomyces sp. NBC_00536]